MEEKGVFRKVVGELWDIPMGKEINEPTQLLKIDEHIYISRRSIKHIIESRKLDGYSADKVVAMIKRILEVLNNADLFIKNNNQTYKNSFVSTKLYRNERLALFVIHELKNNHHEIITIFYRSENKFKKMKQRYLSSASGGAAVPSSFPS